MAYFCLFVYLFMMIITIISKGESLKNSLRAFTKEHGGGAGEWLINIHVQKSDKVQAFKHFY